MDASNYRDVLHRLAPQGVIYPRTEDDSVFGGVLDVIAASLLRVDNETTRVLREIFPDQTGEFLDDWEEDLSLPPEGLDDLTTQMRRDLVLAWINISPYSNKQFFIDIAELAGYSISINNQGDDPTLDDWEWEVTVTPTLTVSYFEVGVNAVGEDLATTADDGLISLLNFFKPAHSTISFV